MNDSYTAIVLAAGLGTRMKSDLPKVLHEICGSTLAEHVLMNLEDADLFRVAVITGHRHELVEQTLGEKYAYYRQTEQLGTAHAVMQAKSFLQQYPGKVLVLCGDAPLQNGNCLKEFMAFCSSQNLDLGVLTAELSDPAGYGRIVRENGKLKKIVEKKDCTPEEAAIREINSGTYCFDTKKLLEVLGEINNNNAQNEYYLTDAVELFLKKGYRADAYQSSDSSIVMAVNDLYELHECELVMRRQINRKHIENGVRMMDAASAYIDRNVTIGSGTVIYPNTILTGKTSIGTDNIIISSRIDHSSVGNGNEIDTSTIEQSTVANDVHIGPYAHLRPNTSISDSVKVGNFVEVKNSTVGTNSKISHLTYVGDGDVGADVNLGCGIVFVNYDGKNKYRTVVEDGAFIGCNVNLIAPVRIGKHAFVAAGSTVTEDVEEDALVIARSKAVTKSQWNKEKN
ncbi:MAG: bifunctional UDP-N-acetylglucosamine diphosphorylase/glucosamine-1-phosphate N-acetyltransferase GlmU [Anaerofustis sp.]